MVKSNDKAKRTVGQQGEGNTGSGKKKEPRIGPSTPVETCSERITSFGGLIALEKLLDLLDFNGVFLNGFIPPRRRPRLGHHSMVKGILILLFVGFQRIQHFMHIRFDPLVTGILGVGVMPAVSTFWRCLRSYGAEQERSLVEMMARLRERVWSLVGLQFRTVHIDMDTTVGTVYGDIEGARKGHNRKNRGKKGLRPVLCFIRETREYLCGMQRKGQTISRKEVASLIGKFRTLLPSCVTRIIVRADCEFNGWESVEACSKAGIFFIFASQKCSLPLSKCRWYRWKGLEYTECRYKAKDWKEAQRYVVVRKRKENGEENLIEEDNYTYRQFVTNLPFRPHKIVTRYDGRADVENQIAAAQREGIIAIPSKSLETNRAFFQIVMLAFNLWRWMKLLAGHQQTQQDRKTEQKQEKVPPSEIVLETVQVTRLKILFLAAKLTFHSNRKHVYFSIHDSRTQPLLEFTQYLDARRKQPKPWNNTIRAGP